MNDYARLSRIPKHTGGGERNKEFAPFISFQFIDHLQ